MIAEAYGASLALAGVLAGAGVAVRERERLATRIEHGPARAAGGTEGAVPALVRRARGRWSPSAARAFVGAACAAAGLRWAGPAGAIAGAAVGVAVAESLRRVRAEASRGRAADDLQELVAALADGIGVGLSVRRALEEAERDAPPSVRHALRSALRRLDLGEPLERALDELRAAAGPDAVLLITLLSLHVRTGGDLAAQLSELVEILGRRRELRARSRAVTAQARASGAVLASLPVVFVGLLSGAGGDGLGAFYRTPLGSALLLGGLALDGLGLLWLRRLARGIEA